MQAYLDLRVSDIYLENSEKDRKGLRHYARIIWNTLTRYVTYDKDAIFKDPNWPHIWS